MSKVIPILANEKTAAQLLDMKPSEFRDLVDGGYLPRPREVAPGHPRWATDELRRIASGQAVDGEIIW